MKKNTGELITHELKNIFKSIKLISSSSYIFQNQNFSYGMTYEEIENSNNSNYYFELNDIIYQLFHCRRDIFSNTEEMSSELVADKEFMEILSEANFGSGTWEPGWRINSVGKDIIVEKEGLCLWTSPNFFYNEQKTKNVGDIGYLFLPKEFRFLNPGFYMALSDAPLDFESCYLKIYWNIQERGVPLLVNKITSSFNKLYIPFQLKVLNQRKNYPRSDSAVLYVNIADLQEEKKHFWKIYHMIKNYLYEDTSIFTKKIGPGVGLAEEIDDGEGFGQRRSIIVADSIISCFRKKITNLDEMVIETKKHFQKQGLDLSAPYLNSPNGDHYNDLIIKKV
ncbi:MAG: T3SS effector HopA1 family protein [Nitrosopumilus sp.]|nr:T3SS effector HopA1 family protein [Nitrosopumilus sp.]